MSLQDPNPHVGGGGKGEKEDELGYINTNCCISRYIDSNIPNLYPSLGEKCFVVVINL